MDGDYTVEIERGKIDKGLMSGGRQKWSKKEKMET
jgi:hypothetical protein